MRGFKAGNHGIVPHIVFRRYFCRNQVRLQTRIGKECYIGLTGK